tara:strand:+ start:15190 stop:15405 length:216 start_codon:yes stop_codon:yes gene_type:complete
LSNETATTAIHAQMHENLLVGEGIKKKIVNKFYGYARVWIVWKSKAFPHEPQSLENLTGLPHTHRNEDLYF